MNIQKNIEDTKLELQISPLIDVVFLLLIYFLVTATLIKKEGDIKFKLPSSAPQEEITIIPVEELIEITAHGAVIIQGVRYSRDDKNLEDLVGQLKTIKSMAAAQGAPFYVNILPNQDSMHERVIDVMDACAAAGVDNLSFSKAQ